jgi:hypothetical protein
MGGVRIMSDLQSQNGQAVSVGDWLITFLISSIPLVGLIMVFVWAFGGGAKESKRNCARAVLIWSLIIGAIGIIVGIVFGTAIAAFISSNYSSYSSFG